MHNTIFVKFTLRFLIHSSIFVNSRSGFPVYPEIKKTERSFGSFFISSNVLSRLEISFS